MRRLLNRLERATSLDRLGNPLLAATQSALRRERLRDLLHGVWLGHPLHPVLIHAPIGAFLSAAILDLTPGGQRAATTLTAVGVSSSLPAAAAGLTDWSSLAPEQRRIGLVHAAGNTVALGLYTASLAARLRGRRGVGQLLGYLGLATAGASAYLGGHLSYQQGAGVNHAIGDLRRLPTTWRTVAELASLPDGQPLVRQVDDVPILLYRHGDRVTAMTERCAHQAGPLGDGKVVGAGDDACVICPWHGSDFRLADGRAVHGPAATDLPLLRVRVVDDRVEVAVP
jgi:nitrite reductase/ring-hydroxylating ferredoxin subunit/uncharacterized membrane protein